MKRNLLKSMIVRSLLALSSLATTFNRNASANAVTIVPEFATASRRKPGFRTGIKGMASSNNTRYGAGLKAYFENKRGLSTQSWTGTGGRA